jgi:hypothetical protein
MVPRCRDFNRCPEQGTTPAGSGRSAVDVS